MTDDVCCVVYTQPVKQRACAGPPPRAVVVDMFVRYRDGAIVPAANWTED